MKNTEFSFIKEMNNQSGWINLDVCTGLMCFPFYYGVILVYFWYIAIPLTLIGIYTTGKFIYTTLRRIKVSFSVKPPKDKPEP